MNRITDFALVEYFVPEGLRLPKEIEDYLKLCIGIYGRLNGQAGWRYEIPHYLQVEWSAKYAEALK